MYFVDFLFINEAYRKKDLIHRANVFFLFVMFFKKGLKLMMHKKKPLFLYIVSIIVWTCCINALPKITTNTSTGNSGSVTGTTATTVSGTTTNNTTNTTTSNVLSPLNRQVTTNLQSSDPISKVTSAFSRHTQLNLNQATYSANPSTAGALQITPKTKHMLPAATSVVGQSGSVSFSQLKKTVAMNESLFAGNSALNGLYQTMIGAFKSKPSFLPVFTRLHITALHQLYQYLMGVYVTLTMTHIDDLQTYVTLESMYALNKKTLIIQHLIELIEAQLNQSLQALMPGMPQNYATVVGPAALNSDAQNQLEIMLVDMEDIACAAMGVAPLGMQEWQNVYNALTNTANSSYLTSLQSSQLQSVITKLNSYITAGKTDSSFIDQLTYNMDSTQVSERTTLIDALELITRNYAYNQQQADLNSLITTFGQAPLPSTTIPYSQKQLLMSIVKTLAYGGELADVMNSLSRIQAQLLSTTIQSLSAIDQSTLQTVLAFVLFCFEQRSSSTANYLTHVLRKNLLAQKLTSDQSNQLAALNDFTEFQKSYLSSLSVALLSRTQQLDTLSDADRAVLSAGLIFLAKTPPAALPVFSTDMLGRAGLTAAQPLDATVLNQLGAELSQSAIPEESLRAEQVVVYKMALLFFQSYTPVAYSIDQAITDMNQKFSAEGLDAFSDLFNQNSVDPAQLASLTIDQQIMGLAIFEALGHVVQGNLLAHESQASTLYDLISTEVDALMALYNGITYEQYVGVFEIMTILKAKNWDLSLLSADQKNMLAAVFSMLKASNGATPLLPTSSTQIPVGILDILVSRETLTTALQKLVDAYGQGGSYSGLKNIYTLLIQSLSTFSQFSNDDVAFLKTQLTSYQQFFNQYPPDLATPTSLQTGSSTITTTQSGLSDLEGIAALLLTHNNLDINQKTFYATIGSYLNFFNNYTNLLQVNVVPLDKQTSQTDQAGLTAFEQLALQVQTSLKGTPLGALNPALFFYDDATMKGLSIIPVLAQMVNGTSSVPLPTFGINSALSTEVSSTDPTKNNKIVMMSGTTQLPISVPSCLITTAGVAPYSPRFFFKDAAGNVLCNSSNLAFTQAGSLYAGQASLKSPIISWLQKVSVPHQTTDPNYQSAYFPLRKTVGHEGLYMNIPTTTTNPNNPANVFIRLYEQPLYSQPDWLNSSAGILTMLKGCLGDFASIVSLSDSIFDPCIELIIRRSLLFIKNPSTTLSSLAYNAADPQVQKLQSDCSSCLAESYGVAINAQQTVTGGVS